MGPNGVYFFFFSSRRRHTRLQGDWSSDVCSSDLGDAVIATDLQGRVTFMNPVAETLAGWNLQDAIGRDMSDVFNIENEDTRQAIGSGISGPTLWPHPWSTPDQSPHNPVRATLVAGAARSPHRLQPPESGN